MMAITTLLLAFPIVVLLHYVFFAKLESAWFGRVVVMAVSVALMFAGSVHLIYVGIEVLLIGLGWLHLRSLLAGKGE